LQRNDAFGYLAFFTDSPHTTTAVAKVDSTVLMLSKSDVEVILAKSLELRQARVKFLESSPVKLYLEQVQASFPNKRAESVYCERSDFRHQEARDGDVHDRAIEPFRGVMDNVQRAPFLANLPSDEADEVASLVFLKHHDRGHTFFHRGEPAERMYVLAQGEVALLDAENKERSASEVNELDAFGAMSFVTGTHHAAAAVAASDSAVWILRRVDFEELIERCPSFRSAVKEYLEKEDLRSYLLQKHKLEADAVADWVSLAVRNTELGKLIPRASEAKSAIRAHHGAPLAIWLGILLDGIPESLVIGAGMVHGSVSLSLIAGLFLSNYPEALSSSIGMHRQGIASSRVLWMWTSLMILTGIGAAFGNLFFREAPAFMFSLVEGVAAGAMLTMIAETMLPEAYLKGGSIVGYSTLLGFLAAIFFKTLGE
jgi:CRP-like cAMP-binding protein